ncbi:YfhO family protein [Vagococcus bubulae]|uniref:Copper ABC transporter permease n=1 Tax=Vagococcus bubulae TaxID=1977868 RepID=A0A429ZLB9_9ENTE|nr:YfhO family protein [Vagococcus bubulae]RST94456.1 copper ABC transporter permease [Vagococcus bubulae]
MLSNIKKNFKTSGKYGLLAFIIPVLVMIGVYLSLSIYPGSSRSVLASDAFSQFSNFHASFNNVLHGKQSIFYTWNASLGLNYWSLISYYLGGIFTPIVFFFNNQNIPDALYLLTLLKIGAAGLSFWYYSKETYKLPNLSHVTLAICYSLMSFATAHSELIMWLDIFMYIPLIFLGINRILDKGKSSLLFVSYFLLFVSNFYFGFMVGLFSFLYFVARVAINASFYKKRIIPYLTTSMLAGIASMVMILPAVFDLRSNGETLSAIGHLKTEATAFWDIVIKNMIGVFDTTKYGSIPFIYAGLLPLIFCIFYFCSNKIPTKNKMAYVSLFVILIASFYIEPLNLFWHGMHAPNMFLFRYSFLFSFLVVMIAGYGWEKFTKPDMSLMIVVVLSLAVLFSVAFFASSKESYTYVTLGQYVLTILFLGLYLVSMYFYYGNQLPKNTFVFLLLLVVTGEAYINTSFMLNGILNDWNYASRSLYSEPYPDYKYLVDKANDSNKKSFNRLESLAPISSNDSFNYGYSGISMFSSIRNRHSSALLNELGFRSRGTSLNIRYQNNTLLMDSLMGIKHNISDQDILKYGFNPTDSQGKYTLYTNDNALPLGILTNDDLYKLKLPARDNLGAQTTLINQLADLNDVYYTFTNPTVVSTQNAQITNLPNNRVAIKEQKSNEAKVVTYQVSVPAGKQAYFSLFPNNFGDLKSSNAKITTQKVSYETQIGITGQYYNLGYFKEDSIVEFSVSFYGTDTIELINPPVVLLDIPKFDAAIKSIQEKGVDFKVSGRKATAHVEIPEEQVVFTTIPYDKGWTVKIDDKKVAIKDFQDGFLTFTVPKGVHDIELSFLPPGLMIGLICFVSATGLFIIYYRLTKVTLKKRKSI